MDGPQSRNAGVYIMLYVCTIIISMSLILGDPQGNPGGPLYKLLHRQIATWHKCIHYHSCNNTYQCIIALIALQHYECESIQISTKSLACRSLATHAVIAMCNNMNS